jgi:peptidoglycan/LPS O-acetylase OafA/YrhL
VSPSVADRPAVTADSWIKRGLPTYEQFRATRNFLSLDGLRAISIIIVVWYHAAFEFAPQMEKLHLGYLGVTFFFAISGFLITTLLLRERETHGDISLKNFYMRRSLRIFPLYYAVILVYILAVLTLEHGSQAGSEFIYNLRYFLTYTSNWFITQTDARVIFALAWSLSTEEQFYMMWPSVEKLLRGNRPVIVASGLIAVSIAASAGAFSFLWAQDSLPVAILTNISVAICFGVILAHVLHTRRSYDFMRWILGYRWAGLVAFILLGMLIGLPAKLTLAWRIPIFLVMALIVGACVIRQDHWLKPLLTSWAFRLIGQVSYGMYLMHMLVYNVVKLFLSRIGYENPLLKFALTLVLTTVVAKLSYDYFESFFLRLKERFSRV